VRVKIMPSAESDLEQIGDWIALGDPRRAITFTDQLRQRCERVGSSPRAYPLIPGHEASGIRRCVYRGYLIFYRVAPELVEVIHVLHGARDVDAILFPDEE
jgi:toxin ParE1/3/4